MYVRMVRFRNVLVHLYGEVDEKFVYEIIEKQLDYFRMFLVDLDEILETTKKEKKTKAKGSRKS